MSFSEKGYNNNFLKWMIVPQTHGEIEVTVVIEVTGVIYMMLQLSKMSNVHNFQTA